MDKWILPDKEMPPTDKEVLVTFEYFRYGEYNNTHRDIGIGSTIRGEWSGIVNGTTGWQDLKIIAWMPLPSIYIDDIMYSIQKTRWDVIINDVKHKSRNTNATNGSKDAEEEK